MGRLDGKVAIVTGAARGQGEATARLFAQEGARVVLTDRLEPEGQAVAGSIGAAARFVAGDISLQSTWDALLAEAESAFGGVDILVNNAAISDHRAFLEIGRERFETMLAINLVGPFLGIQTVLPGMLARGMGSIVNISSVNGMRGTQGQSAYDATKWAVRGLTKSIAVEFGQRGIRCNSVHPGTTHTPMFDPEGTVDCDALAAFLRVPAGRIGQAHEIAPATLFLASDEASYVNGAELTVDGGWSAGIMIPEDVGKTVRQG